MSCHEKPKKHHCCCTGHISEESKMPRWRKFVTNEEKKESLREYKDQLEKELKAVEEEIESL